MFNRSYQRNAVKRAGGGHQVAITVLAATEGGAFYRPDRQVRPGVAAIPCKKRQTAVNDNQFKLPFAMSDEELAEEFERTFR